ncbi:MAG TPA: hypothetical protein VFG10_18890 [Saprospiraceae bacterium]|nr:hypothetical protein [Saprospiraceae bacterium]
MEKIREAFLRGQEALANGFRIIFTGEIQDSNTDGDLVSKAWEKVGENIRKIIG